MHHLLSLDTIQEEDVMPPKKTANTGKRKANKPFFPRVPGADALAMSAGGSGGGGSGSAFTTAPPAATAATHKAPDAVRTARGAQGRAGVWTQDRDEGRGEERCRQRAGLGAGGGETKGRAQGCRLVHTPSRCNPPPTM